MSSKIIIAVPEQVDSHYLSQHTDVLWLSEDHDQNGPRQYYRSKNVASVIKLMWDYVANNPHLSFCIEVGVGWPSFEEFTSYFFDNGELVESEGTYRDELEVGEELHQAVADWFYTHQPDGNPCSLGYTMYFETLDPLLKDMYALFEKRGNELVWGDTLKESDTYVGINQRLYVLLGDTAWLNTKQIEEFSNQHGVEFYQKITKEKHELDSP